MQGLRGTPSRQFPRTGVSWPYILASCLHSHQTESPLRWEVVPRLQKRAQALLYLCATCALLVVILKAS